MSGNYIFHSACYDKELFRRQTLLLNGNSIDYKVVSKSNPTSARAPLSSFFEVEIYFSENDFEKADSLLKRMTE